MGSEVLGVSNAEEALNEIQLIVEKVLEGSEPGAEKAQEVEDILKEAQRRLELINWKVKAEKCLISIEDLEISKRVCSVLHNYHIYFIGQLLFFSRNDMYRLPGIGRKSIEETDAILKKELDLSVGEFETYFLDKVSKPDFKEDLDFDWSTNYEKNKNKAPCHFVKKIQRFIDLFSLGTIVIGFHDLETAKAKNKDFFYKLFVYLREEGLSEHFC